MPGHKFKPERAGHLEGRTRRFLVPPEKILSDFDPHPEETWAEIGAGTGYFVIPLSSRVKKIYALDLSEQMLMMLQSNLKINQEGNVEAMLSEESSLPLPDACVDAVLLAFVLHEVDEPEKFLAETSRITRPGGRILIVEYTQVGSFGPPKSHRLTSQQINDWTAATGYDASRSWSWSRRLLGWKYFDLIGLEYRKRP